MGATLVSPTPQPIYAAPGKNYAPKAPLDLLKQNPRITDKNKFTEAISKKFHDYMLRDDATWREHYEIGKMVANLTSGKLLLLRHAIDNRYIFAKRDGRYTDNKTVGGLFQFYRTKLDAEWLMSRPERLPVTPSDDDQIEEFMEAVKIVQGYYDQRFFNDQYELLEMDSAACYGTWVTRFRFDPDKQDIICELLDFPACRWDIRFVAEESSYFIYQSKCSTAVLSQLFDAEINSDGYATDNYGLKIIEQIARQGGNVAGEGKDRTSGGWNYDNTLGETVVTEMWLRPEAYCDIEVNANEMTLAGVNLPEGRSLLDMFPKGMCIVGINGFKTILAVYAEDHRDHIVTGIYHLQSYSGVGKGVSDAVDVKKEMDDLHSQTMAYIKAHATPATYYAQDMITEEQARNIGKPRKVIPVDFNNAPEGMKSINEAIQAITPQNPATGVWEMGTTLENWLQMSFQVTNFSDGMPGVDNKTATGARIGDAASQTLLVPQHRNKADHRKRADKVIYNLFKKYVDKPKFFATRDLNGITKGRDISGSQFNDVDIDFEIVSDSEVPQNPYKKQLGMTAFLQQSGGLMGAIQGLQMNAEVTEAVATAFGADLPIASKNDIARVCRKRIEQAKRLIQADAQLRAVVTKTTGVPVPSDPNFATAVVSQFMPPITSYEPYYEQKISWLAQLLDDDEMQYAPMELRYVIQEMISQHLEQSALGKAQVAYNTNMANIVPQLPMLLGSQAMSSQNQALAQQFQAQQQAQDAQQQVAQNVAQTAGQLALAKTNAGIQHQQALTAHQSALAQIDANHASGVMQSAQDHNQALALANQQAANTMAAQSQQAALDSPQQEAS